MGAQEGGGVCGGVSGTVGGEARGGEGARGGD